MTLPILHLTTTRDGMMLTPRYDRYVSASLDVYGEYSPEERELLCSLVQPGDVVCQVGANVGAITLPLAHRVGPTGRIFALEPQAADAVVDERIGPEHAGGRTEADEVGAARGQRGVEVPDAVEADQAGQVGLHARGGDQVDVAVHVGAVGAHHHSERAVAA